MEFKSLAGITNVCRPVLVSRQNIVLFANGSCIQSICLRTGNLLGSYDEHKDLVTCILYEEETPVPLQGIPVEERHNVVLSASMDGAVHIWNLSTCATYSRTVLSDPVFKLKLLPRRELLTAEQLAAQPGAETALDVLVTTAQQREGEGEEKVKVHFEVHAHDLQTLQRNEDLATISSQHYQMEYLSFNVSANNKNATHRTVTAIVYIKNKKLMMKLLVPESEKVKAAQVDIGQEILCLTTNDCTGSVGLGLQHGEVLVLHNVTDYLRSFYHDRATAKDNFLTKTIMHWHAHGVLTVVFSDDGKFLYSGGEESVLVAWNITKLTKNFLPRLGAPLCHLVTAKDASKAAKVLTTTLDNCLRFINTANMEVEWFWQSAYIAQNKHTLVRNFDRHNAQFRVSLLKTLLPFRLTDQQSEKTWTCLTRVDPLSGHVFLNGHPGQLQTFDLTQGVVRKNVKVTHFQRVSRKDSNVKLFVPSITSYALDQSGKFLVTLDVRRGEELERDISLKFWEYQPHLDTYELSAQMNAPHGDQMVTDIRPIVVFPDTALKGNAQAVLSANNQTGNLMVLVATSSPDGTVKVWRGNYERVDNGDNLNIKTQRNNANEEEQDDANKKNHELTKIRWKCAYSFQYRNCPVNALAWSNDGSTLVVCHDTLISFWDPIGVSMKHSMTTSSSQKVLSVHILEPRADYALGGGAGEVFFVVVTMTEITVYSLLSFKVLWSYQVPEITASGVAQDERFIALLDDKQNTRIADEGWIAIAVAHPKVKNTSAPAEEEASSKKGKKTSKKGKKDEASAAEASTQKSSAPSFEVLVFSPASAKPISSVAMPSRVVSLDFLARKPLQGQNGSVSGVVGITTDSELFLISAQRQSSSSSGAKKVALVKNAVLPVLATATGKLHIEKKKDSANADMPVYNPALVSRAQSNKQWFEQYLPELTEDLPRPTEIARDFLRQISVMSKHSEPEPMKVKPEPAVAEQTKDNESTQQATPTPTQPEKELPFDIVSAIIKKRMLSLFANSPVESVALKPTTPTPAVPDVSAAAAVAQSDDESVTSETRARRGRKPRTPFVPSVPVVVEEESEAENNTAKIVEVAAPPTPSRRSTRRSSKADLAESDNESVMSEIAPPTPTRMSTRRSSKADLAESDNESVMSESSVRTPSRRGRKPKAAMTPTMETVPEESEELQPVRKSARKVRQTLVFDKEEEEEEEKKVETPVVEPKSARKRKPAAEAEQEEEEPERRSTRRKSTK